MTRSLPTAAGAVACVLLLLSLSHGCGGDHVNPAPSRTAPGPIAAEDVPARQPANQLVPVVMRPQQPVAPPFGPVSVVPTRVIQLAESPRRHAAFLEEDLLRDAGTFEQPYPNANVAVQGDWAYFTPDWEPGSQPPRTEIAYCTYEFYLSGFDRSPTVMFIWHTPPQAAADFWVGLGNVDRQAWDWYEGPADRVLTLSSLDPYTDPGGAALLIVVVLGQEPALLERLIVDAPELRGTGENELVIETCPPPLDPGGPLPAAVDLASNCPPVNDQGWWASCTAFAVGDCAFNFDLGAIYTDLGWDFDDSFNLISPKYLYIESGKDSGASCPWEGRYTGDVVAWLTMSGVATKFNAPYDFSCNDSWLPDALADVPVLGAEDWFCMLPEGGDGLSNIKTVLANHQRPVILRTNIDQAFLDYEAGQVWQYTGPALGSHAMCLVGYDDDADGGSGAFKVRSSWGPDWGDEGHIWMRYNLTSVEAAEPWLWKLEAEYDALTAQRFCGQEAALAPPTALAASQGTYLGLIRLNWLKSPSATGYNIYRNRRDNLVASVADVDSWDDPTVANQLAQTYWVQATAGPAESQLSAPELGWLGANPTEYKHTWGGSGEDFARDVAVDADGNVYVAGHTESFGAGNGDALLCKYNSGGHFEWVRTWGGGQWEGASAVAVAGDYVYLAGSTVSFGEGGNDFFVLRFTTSGTLQLQKTWGGSSDDHAAGLALVDALTFYVVGVTESFGPGSSATVLLRYGTLGLELQTSWGGSDLDNAQALALDSSGNVFVAGHTESYGTGGRDVLLLKYDNAGSLQWARAWGGADNDQAQALSLDGTDVHLAGFTHTYGAGSDDVLLIGYSTDGVFQSAFCWGAAGFDGAYGIAVGTDHRVYLAGQTTSGAGGDLDVLLLALSAEGALDWARIWGGTGRDYANAMVSGQIERLFLAAAARNVDPTWQDFTGQCCVPAGIASEPAGSTGTPTGVIGTPAFTTGNPAGTEDTGGGGDDALVLRLLP